MYRLVFLTGARKGRRVAVQQGSLLIGRDHDVQLDLREDDEVSRHHAIIEQQADGYFLRDLGGMNPAQVNGQPVRGVIKLKQDDQIELGRTIMQFQVVEDASASTRRSAGPLQILTFSLMALLLLGQAAYWVIFPRLHQAPLPDRKSRRPPAPAPAAPGADTLQADLERAIAQAQAEEHAPALPPPPIPMEVASVPTGDVQNLRNTVADLRKQVETLASSVTNLSAVAPPTTPDNADAIPRPDAGAADQAKAMLAEALALEQHAKLVEADALLERIQATAPSFVPAYVERARLYEKRGMLTKAGEQWTQVLNLSTGTPLYDQAANERQRLARAEIMLTVTKSGPAASPQAGAADENQLPRALRIASIEREKFEANLDYDEMRQVRVALRPRASEGDIDVDDVAVTVTFYDRDDLADRVQPTRAMAPQEPLTLEGLWRAGEQRTITAAYIVPRNFRREESTTHSVRCRYEGVRVRVFYKGRLQDEESVPKDLVKLPPPPAPKERARTPAAAAAPVAKPRPAAPPIDDPSAPVSL